MDRLAVVREELSHTVHPGGSVIGWHGSAELRWWTWAGLKANATLAATLSDLTDPAAQFQDDYVRLREDVTPPGWRAGIADAADRICLPDVSDKALTGLKYSAALPRRLAMATLAARLADVDGALRILSEPTRFVTA